MGRPTKRMIITETIETSLNSLFRNKLRSLLTMLGIIIGVSSVIMLVSIGAGLKSYISEQFESLGSNLIFVVPGDINAGGGDPAAYRMVLTMKHVKELKRIGYPLAKVSPGIEAYTKGSYRDNEETIHIIATDIDGLDIMNFEVEKGTSFSPNNINKNSKVAIIGPNISEKLFESKNPVGKFFFLQNSKYKVIAEFKSKGGGGGLGQSMDDVVLIPYTTAMKQFNQDKLSGIYAQASNKDVIDEAKQAMEKTLSKSLEEDEFTVMGQEDMLDTINQILSVMTAALGGIAAISLLVGGIGIMNIMFVTVTERTKEIGLRKALGATPRNILTQFLIESVTVSFVGGTIGILVAMLGSFAINHFFTSEITPFAIILAFGFSTIIGVIFGVIPAWKAAKLDPITALKYE